MAIGAWFATEFDDPTPTRELPAVFASGGDPEVLLADQMARGTAIVGRVQGAAGAVVLKLRTGGRPVRVRIDLHVDGASQSAWSRVASPTRSDRELPRLVMVRAQGTDRAAALISRQRGRLRIVEAHAWVEFDLRADEVGEDGLLIIELADASLPGWAAGSLSPLAAVGVRLNQVEVTAIPDGDAGAGSGRLAGAPAQWAGLVSAGGLVGARGRGQGHARTRFVVVNASAAYVRCGLRIATASAPPAAFRQPSQDWLRRRQGQTVLKAFRVARRGAGQALFEASPFTRPPHPDQLAVRAVNLLDGADCPVSVNARAQDALDVVVERTAPGPVLIGLADAEATALRRRVSEIVCQVVELEW
ncbi:hypothetical protein SAMN05443287_102503 [Micromonospora phaseoli]|uniref:Uncharacterized protein n=1 Tax=Micromonospora phaseoli TaxID=1144548 RepID=A0A1H6V227_9ACTN|nr:hypothetical protein [Micromonospora phaseoli]PZV93744.1 hypothetical protein CLV64_109203 [Micromonospora phaseoli]GIJ79225.1 hypothetical protein Xph01_36570 [Micromonospora phaseoli]SEI98608.1 hypothetical protein SAMN05443287_102503 [Micromonospora phaseoli]